jgi:hypothetical protein
MPPEDDTESQKLYREKGSATGHSERLGWKMLMMGNNEHGSEHPKTREAVCLPGFFIKAQSLG